MPPGLNPGSLARTCSGWADGSADEACHTSARATTPAQDIQGTFTGLLNILTT